MIAFISRHIDHITLVITIIVTFVYALAHALILPFEPNKFIGDTISFALTSGALLASFLVLLIVAGQKDKTWFGNVAPFRFHLGVGCLVAVLAAGSQVIGFVMDLVKS